MGIPLSWLGFLVLVPALTASGVLPFAWFVPEVLPTVLAEAELAFLLFVWPLLLPKALSQASPEGGSWQDLKTLSMQMAVLAVLALPLIVLCAKTAELATGACLRSQALPAGVAAGVGLIAVAARRSGRDPSRLYYLALVTISAALPLTGFVLRAVGATDLETVGPFFGACSPFRAPVEGGVGAWAFVAALFLSAWLCALWPRRSSASS